MPQDFVLDEGGACRGVLSQLVEFVWQQEPSGHERRHKHRSERRENSSDPPCIEVVNAKGILSQTVADDACDQLSLDHEEDVDSNVPAPQQPRECVVSHYSENSNRSQTVEVGPV